jgi:hypothetical protein
LVNGGHDNTSNADTVFTHVVCEWPATAVAGIGLGIAQGFEVFVVLKFLLHAQKVLVGENRKFFAAIFLDDLGGHGDSTIDFPAMAYSIHDNAAGLNGKQRAVVTRPRAKIGEGVPQSRHIAGQAVLQSPELAGDTVTLFGGQSVEILSARGVISIR